MENIKIEWDHDFRDGSFGDFIVVKGWQEASSFIRFLATENDGEVFCVTIMD